MTWKVEANTVQAPSGVRVTLAHPVRETAEVAGVLVVLLRIPKDQSMPENVFGVSADGNVLWQGEAVATNGAQPYFYYAAGDAQGEGWVALWNYGGFLAEVDVHTGLVRRVEERQW